MKADFGVSAAYAVTKAGALVAAAKWAVLLKKDNIAVTSVHPGLVNTWETRGENGEHSFSRLKEGERCVLTGLWFAGSQEMNEMANQTAVVMNEQKGVHAPLITPVQSAEAQIKILDELTMEKTGMFLNYTGEEYTTP